MAKVTPPAPKPGPRNWDLPKITILMGALTPLAKQYGYDLSLPANTFSNPSTRTLNLLFVNNGNAKGNTAPSDMNLIMWMVGLWGPGKTTPVPTAREQYDPATGQYIYPKSKVAHRMTFTYEGLAIEATII